MEFPVYYNKCEVNKLYTEEKGVWTELSFRWGEIPAQVVKLWIDNGAKRFLLGTPYPKDGELTFFRRISTAQWREMSIKPDCKVYLLSNNNITKNVTSSRLSIGDKDLQSSLDGTTYQLRQRDGHTWLTWRWRPGEAFPVPGLFCLTRYQNGRLELQLEGERPVVTGGSL